MIRTMHNATRGLIGLTTLIALACASPAMATENGQVRGLLGAPGYELTSPQFPGLYGQFWLQHYSAHSLRGDDGQVLTRVATTPAGSLPVTVNARISADVFVPRLTWITDKQINDGRVGFSATLPMVSQTNDISLSATLPAATPAATVAAINGLLAAQSAALSGRKRGLSDFDLTGFVDWQSDEGRVAVGVSAVLPTGDYKATRAVNTGAGNFWSVRPILLASRVWENGIELGLRAAYTVNSRNSDTDVRSGQYLHADWAALYRMNDAWRVGLQGYVLQQTTSDQGPLVASNGNKARSLSLGPVVSYLTEDGQFVFDLKVLKEFSVRNRPEGTVTWLRMNVRLD
jgi:hypothetical protein